ncbi:MAG: cytosine/uracil/thiamine/allantoin permease [Limisphaerales bacterium]|jgi:cytosine/uracil/thiamine/allantoin permease
MAEDQDIAVQEAELYGIEDSSLYSEDLAPIPASKRTWTTLNLAAIWVGMAVCIPTYLLASYMIGAGVAWWAALLIILLANVIITVPMVLNGHAGVKYGIPFPVLGRASFGVNGIHLPAVVRALVACGWFGVQTWVGGLAFYAIWCAIIGQEYSSALVAGKFVGFGLFWLINMFFIWRGTESIKWLETWSAPILIVMGLVLIGWGASQGGGFATVLKQSEQLQHPAVYLEDNGKELFLYLTPLEDQEGRIKAHEYKVLLHNENDTLGFSDWKPIRPDRAALGLGGSFGDEAMQAVKNGALVDVQFRKEAAVSSVISASILGEAQSPIWIWIFWLTSMVGFWATMSLSISDITRYASTQKSQIAGQFIGLPGTMLLYSFVGIFVTCAAVINFKDILIQTDAPWDQVSLLARFESPVVVIIAQIFMLIATLSTNIAANVIAPANAFSNLHPKKISFRTGGMITGVIGILMMPWLVIGWIGNALVLISSLLGPILGVMLADYFTVRKKELNLRDLYRVNGQYSYGGSGINAKAILAASGGIALALVGLFVEPLSWMYDLSWFIGFGVSYILYVFLMRN